MSHKFPYRWKLSDGYPAKGIDHHGCKVFGTFICGGGSTMGYKLAGFDHLGGVEIDPQVAAVYKANHKPRYLYTEDIREFNKRTDLPEELFNLDLLDGSPPCSSFSMAGNREKDWGKEKVFREGQAKQRLDDLFFDYIELAKRLQPKVVIAENVKGMLQGNAKAYVKRVKAEFEAAGYVVQLFLLNAASMGVPQRRERVFFVCQRKDMRWPRLVLDFRERAVPFGEFKETGLPQGINGQRSALWRRCEQGKGFDTVTSGANFGSFRLSDAQPSPTVVANQCEGVFHSTEERKVSKNEAAMIGTFPLDYAYGNLRPLYLIGMSVPPVMTAQVAHQVYLQWLSKAGATTGTKQEAHADYA